MIFVSPTGQLVLSNGFPYVIGGKSYKAMSFPQELQLDVAFDYSTIPNGAYAINSLSSEFTNTAGVRSVNGVDPNVDSEFTLLTNASRRDQEVTTWVGKGTVFLRYQNNQAIYFKHNVEGTNGILQIGILNDVAAGGEMPQGIMLWQTDVLNTIAPGYDRTEGSNLFTYGVEGFDIYVKYNGIEFLRFQEYRYTPAGKVGVKMSSNYGVKHFNVSFLITKSLFSNPSTKTIDVRDFGWKSGATTGNILAGSNSLSLNSLPIGKQYAVGDVIILETGGEVGGGLRGTKGVGGTFPSLSYPDLATMQADHSKANGLYAWIESTGDTYYYDSGTTNWIQVTQVVDNGHPFETNYYVGKAVPLALRAKITNISGLTLTLDKTASVTSACNVYYDNSYILMKLGADTEFDFFYTIYPTLNLGDYRVTENLDNDGYTFVIPAGNYAIGEVVDFYKRTNATIVGAGKTLTNIFSPKGTPSANINIREGWGSTFYDFTLSGNAKAEGYGLKWWTWNPSTTEQNKLPQQIYQFSSIHYPYGFTLNGAGDSEIYNARVNDMYGVGFQASFSNTCYIHDCEIVMQDSLFFYISWAFQSADSTDVTFENCTFTSPKIQGGFESFKSTNTHFINCHGTNANFACNNAQDPVFTDCSSTVTADSMRGWTHPFNPIVSVNTNAATGATGGVFTRMIVTIQDYQDADNTIMVGYNIGPQNSGIHLIDCEYHAPNYLAPSISSGPQAIRSDGTGTLIDGFIASGLIHTPATYFTANIAITDGTVQNSTVGSGGYIVAHTGVTLSNNIGNVIFI